jgi:cytochrome c oxidase subunit 4
MAKKNKDNRKASESHGDKAEAEKPSEAAVAKREGAASEAHAHGDGHAHHEHKFDRAQVLKVFVALFVLTVLEVGVAKVPGLGRGLLAALLVGMAVTKAGIVGLYYMHLKYETKPLKLTIAIPLATPALYALVLIAEAAWRSLSRLSG